MFPDGDFGVAVGGWTTPEVALDTRGEFEARVVSAFTLFGGLHIVNEESSRG